MVARCWLFVKWTITFLPSNFIPQQNSFQSSSERPLQWFHNGISGDCHNNYCTPISWGSYVFLCFRRVLCVLVFQGSLVCSCVSGEFCVFLCFREVLCILVFQGSLVYTCVLGKSCVFLRLSARESQNNQVSNKTQHSPHLRMKTSGYLRRKGEGQPPHLQNTMRQSIRICVRLLLTRGVQMFWEIRSSDIKIAGTVSTWSRGVVLVKPRAVTRAPPTVGPRKFPSANAVKWNVG